MATREIVRRVLPGAGCFSLLSGAVAAQGRGMQNPFQDFSGVFEQALELILGIFRLEWLGDDAGSYAALARLSIFLIPFFVAYEVLARFSKGGLSGRTAKIVAFSLALMSVVFMPESWLLGMGTTTAALIAAVPMLAIFYFSFRLTRRFDTSQPGNRIQFIVLYLMLMAAMGWLGTYIGGNQTGKAIAGVSLDIVLWLMYAACWTYLGLTFFTHGLGGSVSGAGGADWYKSGGEKSKGEKKKATTVKAAEKAKQGLEQAGRISDTLRQFGRRQVNAVTKFLLSDEMDLQEVQRIVDDLLAGLQRVKAEKANGNVLYHDANATLYRKAMADARGHIKTLKSHLGKHQNFVRQHRRMLIEETELMRAEKSAEKSAARTLEDRRGQLNSYLFSPEANPNLRRPLSALEGQFDRLRKENDQVTSQYEAVLKREMDLLRRVRRGLSRMGDELKEVERLIKDEIPVPENVEKALPHLERMRQHYAELIQVDRVELTYDREKEAFESSQERIEAGAVKLADEMERLVSQG